MAVKNCQFRTPRRTDAELVRLFGELATELGWSISSRSYTPITAGDALTNPSEKVLAPILESSSCLFSDLRHTHANRVFVQVSRPADHVYDTFTLGSDEPRNQEPQPFLLAAARCKSLFGEAGAAQDIAQFLGADVAAHYQAREEAVVRLETTLHGLTTKIAEFTTKLAGEYENKSARLDAQAQKKSEELDEQYKSKEAAFNHRVEELEKRIAAVNDREHKFERRRTIQDLIDKLDSSNTDFKFQLTSGTRQLRWPVVAVAVVLMLAFGGIALHFLAREIPENASSVQLLWHFLRPSFGVLGFALTAAAFARWLSSWAHQHAEEEFRLKRLLLDVRRANLLIETALEWRQENRDEPLPQELLDALTRGMFDVSGLHEEIKPVDTLAHVLARSVLEAANEMELNIAGQKVKVGAKGLKKLGKESHPES